jgi:hypothetical protein
LARMRGRNRVWFFRRRDPSRQSNARPVRRGRRTSRRGKDRDFPDRVQACVESGARQHVEFNSIATYSHVPVAFVTVVDLLRLAGERPAECVAITSPHGSLVAFGLSLKNASNGPTV